MKTAKSDNYEYNKYAIYILYLFSLIICTLKRFVAVKFEGILTYIRYLEIILYLERNYMSYVYKHAYTMQGLVSRMTATFEMYHRCMHIL
jgi:hypothetical protein